MESTERTAINVKAKINAPVDLVWKYWVSPEDIVRWNNASEDWHTTRAENDLRAGGNFNYRMEARDGSTGFDFAGVYEKVEIHKQINYTLGDGRNVKVVFSSAGTTTEVEETFEAENTNSVEMQRTGWQAILDNFRKYVETPRKFEVIHFETKINANAEKVYKTMFDEKNWTEWTGEFNASSYYKGSWEKGSKILFLATGQAGNMEGMVSKIKENIPNRFVSIEHLGIFKDGEEITSGPEIADWAGALENYSFTEVNGQTSLSVDMDTNQKYESYFKETWPKALKKLKEICEI